MTRDWTRPASRGAILGALWVGGLAVGATLSGGDVLAEIAQEVLLVTPGPLATVAIELLGTLAKPALLVAVGAAAVALAAAGGVAWRRTLTPAARGPAAAVALAGTALLLLLSGASISPGWLLATLVAVGLPALVAYGRGRPGVAGRRSFLRRAGVAAGALAGAGIVGIAADRLSGGSSGGDPLERKRGTGRTVESGGRSAGSGAFNFGEMPAPITPTSGHYVVDINYQAPDVDPAEWTLSVTGAVEEPLSLSYEDLLTHEAAVTRTVTMVCISNPVGGKLISTARWRGVPLAALLDEAGVEDDAVDVVTRALDEYSEAIPPEVARREGVMLAVGMNGEPLPRAHGRPARLLIPGRYGMKSTKWVDEIEVSTREYAAYWESRGWVEEAVVNTLSYVRAATRDGRRVVVGGVAYAGTRGIERVEVSVDGGDTWHEAELEAQQSPYAWRRWRYEFEKPEPGRFEAVVRAVDGGGEVQTSEQSGPHPGGSTGWHRKTFQR